MISVSADPAFRTVLRGYEPKAVRRRIVALTDELCLVRVQLAASLHRLDERTAAAESATGTAEEPTAAEDAPRSFEGLGRPAGETLALVEAEAAQIRTEVEAEAEARLHDADEAAAKVRAAADRYADAQRTDAGGEGARILAAAEARAAATRADAERRAQQLVDGASARADRIRAESDRRTAAAEQRRDSINAQLASVRQMLSALLPRVEDRSPDPGSQQRMATATGDGPN